MSVNLEIMTKTIEVEMRGLVPAEEFERVKGFLENNAEFKGKKERILLDYSTFLEGGVRERTLDIRARITNGQPEMIIKKGAWGGSDSREEISVMGKEGSFTNMVRLYAALGYKKAVLVERNSMVYQYGDTEISLVEAPGHSHFFELEQEVQSKDEIESARKALRQVSDEMGLKVFSDEEWFDYIELLNKEANGVFDFDVDGPDFFKNKYGI